jgi:hypothetical protein
VAVVVVTHPVGVRGGEVADPLHDAAWHEDAVAVHRLDAAWFVAGGHEVVAHGPPAVGPHDAAVGVRPALGVPGAPDDDRRCRPTCLEIAMAVEEPAQGVGIELHVVVEPQVEVRVARVGVGESNAHPAVPEQFGTSREDRDLRVRGCHLFRVPSVLPASTSTISIDSSSGSTCSRTEPRQAMVRSTRLWQVSRAAIRASSSLVSSGSGPPGPKRVR